MGRKLYEKTPQGGIKFTSHRMGQVRVANYVYDIWLPILGARGVAVYSVYCRLEREGVVKAITQADLAKACRIGSNTLRELNQLLEECGFIKITSPASFKRLMHWTVEIEVFDPPIEVPAEIIERYQHPQGYQALSTWLVAPEKDPEKLYSFSGETDEYVDEKLYSTPKIVSLGLHPLEDSTPAGVVTEKPLQTHVEKEESVGVRESLSTEESISFTTPPPRQKRTAQDVRAGAARAIAKFEKRHDNGIDPAWRNVPVYQGQILTEFTRLSGISIPKTKRLRDSATYAAEVLYQETGSAAECVRRMQSFFAERAGGQEHQFAIADLNSIVKTICAMSAADAGPKVIRLGQ